MTAKLFGYLKFPSRIFEIDTAQNSRNEIQKNFAARVENDPSLLNDEEFMCRNNTYAEIPPFPIFYHSRAQTSLLRSVFMCLQENNTKEIYLQCSFDHFNCNKTRIEHFIHDLYSIFFRLPKQKKKRVQEIPWLSESYVQRFYNNSMTFKEFGDSLLNIYDFKSNTSSEVVTLCWKTFNRETFLKISDYTLAAQLDEENLRKLFEIFIHLDNNMMCRITPFLLNQYITWWVSESGVKITKETQNLAEWYKNAPTELVIDFPEFLKQIYRLFLSGVPYHIYKTLISDAWDSIVAGVVQKGVLEKVGPNKGRWLPRVMYLYIDRIDYFKKKSDGTVASKGTIHLGPKSSVVEIFSEDRLGFFQLAVACSESMRRYLLRSDDQRIRHIWVTNIQNVLDVMKGAVRPMTLEKPLKFIEDTEGDLVRLRSLSTTVGGVNTLDGRQIVFKNRYSDDFTKHFKLNIAPTPFLRRSSSFTKIPPSFDEDNQRNSVVSKSSTMSQCMDQTISPHPSAAVNFFATCQGLEFSVRTDSVKSPSTEDSDAYALDYDYESMVSTSTHSGDVIKDATMSLTASKVPIFNSDEEILSMPQKRKVQKSYTIDDNLNFSGNSSNNFRPPDAETPIPRPRKKLVTTRSSMLYCDIPTVPVRRLPEPPARSSSILKVKMNVYENSELFSKL